MPRAALLLLCLLLAAEAARADEDRRADIALLGLLELPGLEYEGADFDLRLRPAPDAAARPVRRLRDSAALATREYGYERPGAIVFERRPGWFRIRLRRGAGWLAEAPGMHFHSLETLVSEHLAHLTPAWDGRLGKRPGAELPKRGLPAGWRKRLGDPISVEIEESRRLAGEIWARLAIPWPPPCASEAEKTIARGWIPLRAPDGRAAVWFFARGC